MYKLSLSIILFLGCTLIYGQQPLGLQPSGVSVLSTGGLNFFYGNTEEAPRAISFEGQQITSSYFVANINRYLSVPDQFIFREVEATTDRIGMRHVLLQQYYNGLPVEGAAYRVHERNGHVTAANGKAIRRIHILPDTRLTEGQALQQALHHLNSQDTTPHPGKKLIVSKNFTFTPESFFVAYQFDIQLSLTEAWRISIDATTGLVINKVSLVNSCFHDPKPPVTFGRGTGKTWHYGIQEISIDEFPGAGSQLYGQTAHGGMIKTCDFGNRSVLAWIFGNYDKSPIWSSDNAFMATRHQAAVSVHWAAEQTYEYYYNRYGRNSYNNTGGVITSYVHVDNGMNNAFWSDNSLLFGDGTGNTNPLVELDVVSHEFTHGVTQYEASLQYYMESGALNESFSDIFAKVIEFRTFGDTATWQLARRYRFGGLRDMSNPNIRNQPDTYLGDLWYSGGDDNGGVHYNSGVQNFWFYLLCRGGQGINDHAQPYLVDPIDMNAAADVAYRNLTEYLSATSDYLDSRIGSLLAAADLYGKNSNVYNQVEHAWDAVGVIDEPIITGMEIYDITATTAKIRGSLTPRGNTASYYFEYGTTSDYGSTSKIFPYTNKVEGFITGLKDSTHYYIRMVARNENGDSYYPDEFTTRSLRPFVKIKHTVDVTETSASLKGFVNPNSLNATYYFEYGTTPALGSQTATYTLPDTTEFLPVETIVTGLEARKEYYYRLIAYNSFSADTSEMSSFFSAVKPVITSVSPLSAKIGDDIIITGHHFNPQADQNIVYFGATRATVFLATESTLQVKMPKGASYGAISIVDKKSGLSAKSPQNFLPTYTGSFSKQSMQKRVGLKMFAYKNIVRDMDADGKPDIVMSGSPGFQVFQNTNEGEDISETSFIRSTYAFTSDTYSQQLWIEDMDGNGLGDVILHYYDGIRIYPNYSVPGYLFFGAPIEISFRTLDPIFEDFDQDGLIDIAGIQYLGSDTSALIVFRNENPKGLLAAENFYTSYKRKIPGYIWGLTRAHLNTDNFPDLIASTLSDERAWMVKNISQARYINFITLPLSTPTLQSLGKYRTVDLNQDGREDLIAFSQKTDIEVFIHENKSDIEQIEFTTGASILKSSGMTDIKFGDMDGDGLVDLLTETKRRELYMIGNKLKAQEPVTADAFATIATYGIPMREGETLDSYLSVNDLNGDGRPEIINNMYYYFYPFEGYNLEIWQNTQTPCSDPEPISIKPTSTGATIVYPPNRSKDDYIIQYRPQGGTDWYNVSESTLYWLTPGYAYQIRYATPCHLNDLDFKYITFVMPCGNPQSFQITSIGSTSIIFGATDLSRLEVQYSLKGQNQWTYVNPYNLSISNLSPGTAYDLRYRGNCFSNVETAYYYIEFTTLCPKITSIKVDIILPNAAQFSASPSLATRFEYSTDNTTWFVANEQGLANSLTPGIPYTVRGRLICTNTNAEYTYATFTIPCPRVAMFSVEDVTPFHARIIWWDASSRNAYIIKYKPAGGQLIATSSNTMSIDLDNLIPGTTYEVTVAPECSSPNFSSTTFNTVCYSPTQLSLGQVSQTSATLSWKDAYGAVPYILEYTPVGTSDTRHLSLPASARSTELTDLLPGISYKIRLYIQCNIDAPFEEITLETPLYNTFTYYPNPTSEHVILQPTKNLLGRQVSIYDSMGKLIRSEKLSSYRIDLGDAVPGLYTILIEGEKPIKIFKT